MKKFVMGLILGAGLMMGISAHAEVVNFVGETIEGQFPVKVQGEEISSPGIVVNGTSYLPTRTIAELAGYDVAFDADLGIELTKENVEPIAEVKQMSVTEEVQISIPSKIESLTAEILTKKMQVAAYRFDIDHGSEEVKANAQNKITSLENEIASLESQKAELQAQLQTP